MLETLDFTIRIGSTPTFLYFNLYVNIRLFMPRRGTTPKRVVCHSFRVGEDVEENFFPP